jgi:hemerythrin
MPLIVWKDEFSVNVKLIDDQHRGLVKLINDLFDAMKIGKGKDVLTYILDELVTYTTNHFATEERFFADFGYADATAHIVEHKKFVAEVSKFKADFATGRLGVSTQIMNFLSDWLTNHILAVDQKYAPLFKQKGLQ